MATVGAGNDPAVFRGGVAVVGVENAIYGTFLPDVAAGNGCCYLVGKLFTGLKVVVPVLAAPELVGDLAVLAAGVAGQAGLVGTSRVVRLMTGPAGIAAGTGIGFAVQCISVRKVRGSFAVDKGGADILRRTHAGLEVAAVGAGDKSPFSLVV